MLFTTTLAAASLLVVGAQAGVRVMAGGSMAGSRGLERRLRQEAEDVLERRQSQPSSASVIVGNGTGGIDMAKWDQETSLACNEALSQLNVASNPSGTAICYNLPALDNQTGIFEADLRLYQLSEPSGAFSGIPPQNIQVGLIYHGASVSPVDPEMISARGYDPLRRRADLKLLQAYLFVGQIDSDQVAQASNNMALLEALVMPTVTLTGVDTAGKTVTTNVSSNEAAFVSGVFSKEIIMSPAALAQMAVDQITLGLQNSTVTFVLPGVQILIFPIGLVITSIWLIAGAAVILFGTFERMSYREQYRKRIAMQSKGGMSTL